MTMTTCGEAIAEARRDALLAARSACEEISNRDLGSIEWQIGLRYIKAINALIDGAGEERSDG